MANSGTLQWKVHTARLLREIVGNNETGAARRPVQILGGLLAEVAQRAAELNDPKLNALMCRLALYSVADPDCDDFNADIAEKVIAGACA